MFGELRPGSPDPGDRVQTADQFRAGHERGRGPVSVAHPAQRHPIQSVSKTTLRFHPVRRELALDRRHVVQSKCTRPTDVL